MTMTNPTAVSGYSFGHDFSAMVANGAGAFIPSGGTEYPGSMYLAGGGTAAASSLLDLAGLNSDTGNGWYVANAQVWFNDSGGDAPLPWGMSQRSWHGATTSPAVAANSQTGAAATLGYDISVIYQYGGASLNVNNTAFVSAFHAPNRPIDILGNDNAAGWVVVVDYSDKLAFVVDHNNRLGVRVGDAATGIVYPTTLRVHCGCNVVGLRTSGTGFTVNTWHDGQQSVAVVIGSNATTQRHLGTASANGHFSNLFWRCDYFFNVGTMSDATMVAMLNFVADKYGCAAFTRTLFGMGDSFLQNFWGVAGSSVLGRVANSDPTLRVENFGMSGAPLGSAGSANNNISVLQLAKVIAAAGTVTGTKMVLVQGIANDLSGGSNSATIISALTTIYSGLIAGISGVKIIPVTGLPWANAGANDASILGNETTNRAVQASILAGAGGRVSTSLIIDNKALIDTLTGSAADVKTTMRNSTLMLTPNGAFDWVSSGPLVSADLLHGNETFMRTFAASIKAKVNVAEALTSTISTYPGIYFSPNGR